MTSFQGGGDSNKSMNDAINSTQQEAKHLSKNNNSQPNEIKTSVVNTGQQHDEMLYTKASSKLQMNDVEINTFQRDKRVSLTVRPRIYNTDNDNSMMRRVIDILGGLGDGNLFNYCLKSYGIIFPYTPQISGLGKTVTYESVDIPHSNLKFNQYKNTSSNDISLKAKFTADTRKNALHMLSALWFLNACSMSKFGKSEGNDAGLPPPILYLSGYNNMIDNIPVVISSFNYSLDDKLHYVEINLNDEEFDDTKNFNNKNLTYWVPTEMDFDIKLKVQPNLRKVFNQWSLNKYKSGELFLNNMESRNPGGEYIPSGWTW